MSKRLALRQAFDLCLKYCLVVGSIRHGDAMTGLYCRYVIYSSSSSSNQRVVCKNSKYFAAVSYFRVCEGKIL